MRPLLHVNAIKRRDKKHSPPTAHSPQPWGRSRESGQRIFQLPATLDPPLSTLDSWAADMSATLSKGNRRSSARWLYTTFLAVVYVVAVVVVAAVSGAGLSSCFTFDVQKCRLSRPKLTEIYANAKVNKRSLHKLCERQRHINWVWLTDWLSVWATGRPTSWQPTVESRQQQQERHGRGRLQLRSLPGRQGPLFLLLPCLTASAFRFFYAHVHTHIHTHTPTDTHWHWHFDAAMSQGKKKL